MSMPSRRIDPPRAGFSREMARSSAVLPAPLGPSTPTIARSGTSSETPRSTSIEVYPERSDSTDSIGRFLAQVGLDHRGVALDDRRRAFGDHRSEEHTSELQSQFHLVCRLLL